MDNLEVEDEPGVEVEPDEEEAEPQPQAPPSPPKISIALDPGVISAEVNKAQTTVASLRRELATKSVEVAQLGRVLTMYTQTGGTPDDTSRFQILEQNIKEANDRYAHVVAENAVLMQRAEMLIGMHLGQGQVDLTPILRDSKVQQLQSANAELQKQVDDMGNALSMERSTKAQVGKLEEDWNRQRDEMQAQSGALQQERDEGHRQIQELASEIEDLHRQIAARDEQIRDLFQKTTEEAQSAQYKELTRMYETALAQARELENQVAVERSQKEQAVAAWQEYTRKQADDARLQMTALQGRVAQLELDLKAAAAGQPVTVSMDGGKISSLEQSLRDASARLNEANRKLSEAESRAAAAETRLGSVESALQQQQQINTSGSADSAQTAALETALRDQQQAYAAAAQRATEMEQQVVYLQQSLVQHQQALQQYQVAFQQLQAAHQDGSVAQALQAQVTQLEQALVAQQQHGQALTAQLQQTQAALQQAQATAEQPHGASHEDHRAVELEAKLAALETTVQDLQATNAALTSAAKRVADLEAQVRQSEAAAHQNQGATEAAAAASHQIAELTAALAARTHELTQLKARLESAEEAVTHNNMDSGQRAQLLEKNITDLKTALANMEQEKIAAQERLDETVTSSSKVQARMLEELAQLRVMVDDPTASGGLLVAKQKALEAEEERARDLEAQVAELETRLAPLEEERWRLLPRIQELEAQLAAAPSGAGAGDERLRAQLAEQATFTLRLLQTMHNFITKAQEEVRKRAPQTPGNPTQG